MKVHTTTIEMLIALYNAGHQILTDEYDAEHEGEDALEGAAMDYMTSREHARFCGLFDNLDPEVRCELVALMQWARDHQTPSAADFDQLTTDAEVGPETGEMLFGINDLPDLWQRAYNQLEKR
ncbi:hypothetical protein [Pontiella sp.]|uniref:hypothetical protein n=1 Tax=Pontiella sp. TaxID=2837462 RepID=UPI0035693534